MVHRTIAEWALFYRVHRNTVLRWHTKGIDGVKLRLWRKGKRWVADEEDIATFFLALADGNTPVQVPQGTARVTQKLDRDLEAAGW